MNVRPQLDHYLSQARQRLRWILSARGAVLLVGALLAVTLGAAWLLPKYGFTDSAALLGRLALLAAAVGVGAWLWLRWRAQEQARGAAALERAMPDQSGRIATYLQESAKAPDKASVLLDLLAADALAVANRESLEQRIRARRFLWPALGALAGVALLGGLLIYGKGLGEGARQLWLGRLPPAVSVAAAAGGISVQPGDATIRRNQDLAVGALIAGSGEGAELHVRFDNGGEWETATMERRADGGFDYTIFAVRDGASYYVTAGRLKSKEHRITVVDLPTVESLKLSYDYPGWTGLPDREEESGGDVRAVAGTQVSLSVTTSAPLEGPLLVIDGNGEELRQSGATSRGRFAVEKDSHYRIATRFLGEIVPLTPDYAIEVVEDQKPEVRIVRPGRDYRATAIEEVPVRVNAKDDFRLDALELHYSVNGAEWQKEPLPAGSDDIEAAALLRLEQMQQAGPDGEAPLLVPGDLVSYFAEARDHSHSVQTDLFLIQVQPFEQRYTQSQAGGGGGGGGGGGEGGGEDDGNISRRQREVLLATWNLQRNEKEAGERERERVADNARMLADVQNTLAEQARTLIQRTQSRELTGQDRNIDQFVKALQDAAKAMEPAAQKLASMDLKDAVTHEQQALQHLLRAESSFRDIEVAMQQGGGGGGGGGAQAGRDVSEMTELELDLAKNQYETEQPMSSQQGQQQGAQQEDELARRLRELARRQEQLAEQARRQQIPPETQRWQQEQLRREAEQLRRELEQLAQQNSQQSGQQQGGQQQSGQQQSGQQQSGQQQGGQQQGGQQQSGQRSAQQQRGQQQGGQQQGGQQQSGQQQGGQQQSGQQSARAASAAEAARQLAEATRQMASGDREAQARASEQLNRAREQLDRARQERLREDSNRFENLADNARALANQQSAAERELRAATQNPIAPGASAGSERDRDNQSGLSFEEMDRMAEIRRQLRADLEELQRQMDSTRRAASETTPRAARELAEAGQELRELGLAESIDLSARQIQADRGRTAANREPFITDSLERLARELESIADVAAGEAGRQQQRAGQADMEDLAAEVGDLRRMLDRAREQTLAQNRTGGDQNTSAPNAREGQQGQQGGGQQGQQGQGGQGERGQGGDTPGEQGGQQAGSQGGVGDLARLGGGADNFGGGDGRFLGGGTRFDRPAIGPGLRNQMVLSADQLARLREELRRNGALTEADASVLQELTNLMRRSNGDPMDAQYQRMAALVNQVELIALKARQEQSGQDPTRATETVDDSRQYRDNVAEYYRRLGGGDE